MMTVCFEGFEECVKTSQLDTCKRSKIQLSKQKYNFCPVIDGD